VPCRKYKRLKPSGVSCEKCGVEVALPKSSRAHGHIELASTCRHILSSKSPHSRIVALDIPLRDIERVLYFDSPLI